MGKEKDGPKASEEDDGGAQLSPADAKAAEAKAADAKAAAAAKEVAKKARQEQNRILRERFAEDPSSLTPEELERAKTLQRVLDKTQQARDAQKKASEELPGKESKTDIELDKPAQGKKGKSADAKRPLDSAEQQDSEQVTKKQKQKDHHLQTIRGKAKAEAEKRKEEGDKASKEGGSGAEQKASSDSRPQKASSDSASKSARALAQSRRKQKEADKVSKGEGAGVPKATVEDEEDPKQAWKEQAGPEQILENQLLRARYLKNSDSLTDADKERAEILLARDERQKEKRQVRRDAKAAKMELRTKITERYKEQRRERAIALGRTEKPAGGRGGAGDKGRGKGGKKGKDGAGKSGGKGKVPFSGRGRGGGKSSGRGENPKAEDD